MIAADISSLIAYLGGAEGPDVDQLAHALSAGEVALPPVVLTELLADRAVTRSIETDLASLAVLEVTEGYWLRAGNLRRTLHAHGFMAKVADALTAQSCIDHGVALITRDRDFRRFARHCGLLLA
jgi:predicted nucleic acid-binding protein